MIQELWHCRPDKMVTVDMFHRGDKASTNQTRVDCSNGLGKSSSALRKDDMNIYTNMNINTSRVTPDAAR